MASFPGIELLVLLSALFYLILATVVNKYNNDYIPVVIFLNVISLFQRHIAATHTTTRSLKAAVHNLGVYNQ